MASINLENLVKRFGDVEVLHAIDLDVKDGEFAVFVGPSGCGKSTTLRMIAGLESVTSGKIMIGDRDVSGLVPRERNISMVFQDYALYPHMTVRQNLGFGLKVARVPKAEIDREVAAAAQMLGLNELLNRKPGQLSGGQRQRVAMGRAIVRKPDVYLFDEPLSNLDAKLRTQMRAEIKRLHMRVGNTVIYVTHDQIEAMTMADRIVVMRDGYIEQVGTPEELYHRPANTFVATFIGSPPMNLIEGTIEEADGQRAFRAGSGALFPVPGDLPADIAVGRDVTYGVRPEAISPDGYGLPTESAVGRVRLPVDHVETMGAETVLTAMVGETRILSKMFNPRPVQVGEEMDFVVGADHGHLFEPGSQRSMTSAQRKAPAHIPNVALAG